MASKKTLEISDSFFPQSIQKEESSKENKIIHDEKIRKKEVDITDDQFFDDFFDDEV